MKYDAKAINQLVIYKKDKAMGELNRTSTGCEVHIYKDFIKNSHEHSLSYNLVKQDLKLQGANLPPYFAGLLPEGLRLKALIKAIKTSEDDMYSLLACIGSQCIGDIYVLPKGHQRHEAHSKILNIKKLKEVSFYELFDRSVSEDEFIYAQEAFAGVQEKLSSSMISFPLNIARKNKSYILKLNAPDKPNLVENEFLTLNIAKKCGLSVNQVKIVKDAKGKQGLLVERFDRICKNEKIVKIHQEDACQFLNVYPADKYRLSFRDICQKIEKLATASKIEILNLIKQYTFNYLIGNGDMHAKNISLCTDPVSQKTKLTPAYDLLCTYIYKDHKMALKLNGRDDNIKKQDIINFGKMFSIPEKAIKINLEKLGDHFSRHYGLLTECMTIKQKNLYLKLVQKRLLDIHRS